MKIIAGTEGVDVIMVRRLKRSLGCRCIINQKGGCVWFPFYSFFPVCWIRNDPKKQKEALELIEGERLLRTLPEWREKNSFCFSSSHFGRLRSRSTLLYPHLIIVSPVFFYFPIYIVIYIKKVRVTIFHLLSSNQEMKRSFPSHYRQKATSE